MTFIISIETRHNITNSKTLKNIHWNNYAIKHNVAIVKTLSREILSFQPSCYHYVLCVHSIHRNNSRVTRNQHLTFEACEMLYILTKVALEIKVQVLEYVKC